MANTEKGSELLQEITREQNSQSSLKKEASAAQNSLDESDVVQRHSRMQYILTRKKRSCPLKCIPYSEIDYKNVALLMKYTSDRGRILPSRVTAISAKLQRKLAKEIKIARYMGFLTYVRR